MNNKDKFRARWNIKDRDVVCFCPKGSNTFCDAGYFVGNILDFDKCIELERRGYDLSTLKFEISPQKGNNKFCSQRIKDDNHDTDK